MLSFEFLLTWTIYNIAVASAGDITSCCAPGAPVYGASLRGDLHSYKFLVRIGSE